MQNPGHQPDYAEKAEQAGRGSLDGFVGPLALGFPVPGRCKAKMSPQFLEGDFDVPAGDESGDNLPG